MEGAIERDRIDRLQRSPTAHSIDDFKEETRMCWTCNPICNRCGKKTGNPKMLLKVKICPQCGRVADYHHTTCPSCKADIANITWDNSMVCKITEEICEEPCKLGQGFGRKTVQNKTCPWKAAEDLHEPKNQQTSK